jgi:predicted nucleotidyltransferase
MMTVQDELIQAVLNEYPNAQAIYLFGSWGTEDEWPGSDVDTAVLLPPLEAKRADFWTWSALTAHLGEIVHKPVDLVNARQASTVLRKEIVMSSIAHDGMKA